jgi:hypothetical protein
MEFTVEQKKNLLSLDTKKLLEQKDGNILRLPRSTLIVGDAVYNRVWHPAEEFEKAAGTMDRQPWNVDHMDMMIEYEIGWMEDPLYDTQTKKLSAVPVLNLGTKHGPDAFGYIQNRLLAGRTPETSVGFWCDLPTEKIAQLNDIEMKSTRNIEFDHNALVVRGSCGPSAGAGIGLSQQNQGKKINNMEDQKMNNENTTPPAQEKNELKEINEAVTTLRQTLDQVKDSKSKEYQDALARIDKLEKQLSQSVTHSRDNDPQTPMTPSTPMTPEQRKKALKNTGIAIMKMAADSEGFRFGVEDHGGF